MQPEQPSDSEKNASRPPVREVEPRQSETFFSLYSNHISVRTVPWDIQLTFGEILSVDERKLVVENQLAINLSPQTAKSLLNVLAGQIQAYEQQFGEIRYNPIQASSEEPSA